MISKPEFDKIVDALVILNSHFGGEEWTIKMGPTVFEPGKMILFKQVFVNGEDLGPLHLEEAMDRKALGK